MTETSIPAVITAGSRRTSWAARILAVLIVLVAYYLIKHIAETVATLPLLSLPEEWWVRAFQHHLVQMICAVVAIALLSRGRWRDWGLNLKNPEESIRILKGFFLYYGVYFIGVGFVIQLLLFPAPTLTEEMTARSVVGKLAFGFLFVGISEEILFRGLFHTFLALSWSKVLKFKQLELPVAGIIATLVFVVAPIGLRFNPFEVTHLYMPQLLMALGLGLFYSWAYHRTGSLLAPILAHNLSDGLLWMSEYTLVWLKT